MHILFFTDNFWPESNAPAIRTHAHCKEWVRQGHRVTVLTCAPNFPRGQVFQGYKNRIWQVEHVDGIRVIRVWSFMAPNTGTWLRVLDFFSYMVMACLASFFVRRVDVIVGTSPQPLAAVAAWFAAFTKGRPWVLELRDLWVESIRELEAMSWGMRLLRTMFRWLYLSATEIVVVTTAFRHRLKQEGVPTAKIKVVTNGVDLEKFAPAVSSAGQIRADCGTERLTVGYIGTMGLAHGLNVVLDAAEALQNHADIRFLLVGEGAEKSALEDRAKGLRNVEFAPSVSHEKISDYWSRLDVCLVPLRKKEIFKTVIPSKLFEAMAMGVPVILGVDGEARHLVEDWKFGKPIAPENSTALIHAIKELCQSPKQRQEFSENGLKAAQHFDRKVLANEMLGVLCRAHSRMGRDPATRHSGLWFRRR